MKGIIGRKIGMTSLFDESGNNLPCTLIEAGPCVVTQLKTMDVDGYEATQLGFMEAKEKNTPKPMQGHFKKANTSPKRKLVEFSGNEDMKLGDVVNVDIFEEGDIITAVGTSKGKGFQGVVKRHGFHGVGGRTHGQHNRERAPGSIGMSSTPSRVMKGMRMAGRTGNDRTKTKKIEILKIFSDKNLLVISGCIAGAKGSYVIIEA